MATVDPVLQHGTAVIRVHERHDWITPEDLVALEAEHIQQGIG